MKGKGEHYTKVYTLHANIIFKAYISNIYTTASQQLDLFSICHV